MTSKLKLETDNRKKPRSPEIKDKIQGANKCKRKVTTPQGVTYNSILEASRELKDYPGMIIRWCKLGAIQREKGMNAINTYVDYRGWVLHEPEVKHVLNKKVETPDGIFNSVKETADYYNITSSGVCQKLRLKKPGWRYYNEGSK